MNQIILGGSQAISHILGQSLIKVEGDTAGAETFFLGLFQIVGADGQPRINQLAGRFVDRLERIDGGWKIKHRTAVRDVSVTVKIEEDYTRANGLKEGRRDAEDLGVALIGIAHRRG